MGLIFDFINSVVFKFANVGCFTGKDRLLFWCSAVEYFFNLKQVKDDYIACFSDYCLQHMQNKYTFFRFEHSAGSNWRILVFNLNITQLSSFGKTMLQLQ